MQAQSATILTGMPKLACEAILCLSTGSPPNQCSPSLSQYFSIDFDDWGDTVDARLNFLELCPVSSQTPQMQSLVSAIANGAGRCDAASLNATLIGYGGGFGGGFGMGCIANTKPSYCSSWESHEYSAGLSGGAHYVIDAPTHSYWPFDFGGGGFGMGGGTYHSSTGCGHWVQ